MPIRNLDRIFAPRSLAVIGASGTPGKVGYTVFQNLTTGEFSGEVFAVNAKRAEIQGRRACRTVSDLPSAPDLAVICTPAVTVPEVIRECGQRGILGVIVLTAGFRELGKAGMDLEKRILAEQANFPGMRIIGPNCLGVICPALRMSASFAIGIPKPGSVAFLSQSGALCTAVLDWAIDEGIGFSQIVSVGNMLDVGFADILDYLVEDASTKSAVLYIESLRDARYFLSAARAFARYKPLIAYKAGRFAESAQAASSHTGAMAGVDAVYQAAFDRAGIVRAFDLESLFECAELLAFHPTVVGSRLAIVTNAGGPGVMATDALLEHRGELAKLTDRSISALNAMLPQNWSHGNPVDVLGDADPGRFSQAVQIALDDEHVDTVLAILTPQAMTDPTESARQLTQLRYPAGKTLLAAWMGGGLMREGIALLQAASIPTFRMPEQAIRGFANMIAHAKTREVLYETPREIVFHTHIDQSAIRESLRDKLLPDQPTILSEYDSKEMLKHYGIPTTPMKLARTADEAAAEAGQIGFPVVLKICSPQISHKTEVEGVALNLQNEQAVCDAFQRMTSSARTLRPDAEIQGVSVQPMITTINGVELILGAKRDPVFGTVMMLGLGGITAELFQDRSLELPPVNERLARRMLSSLRIWPLLSGFRGRPAVNLDQLVEIIIRFSALLVERSEIFEADVNPLVITPQSAIALDARFVLGARAELSQRPHGHLAIRPYPVEFEQTVTTGDGVSLLFRPIRPEDEPAWKALLAGCSRETLWSRFHFMFREVTHEMATRFCFLDYDREMAIVAELESPHDRRIVGVACLIADADHNSAEFALLVADHWQSRKLGTMLASHCMKIAESWGIQRIVAETTPLNHRMIAILKRHGFSLTQPTEPEQIVALKQM